MLKRWRSCSRKHTVSLLIALCTVPWDYGEELFAAHEYCIFVTFYLRCSNVLVSRDYYQDMSLDNINVLSPPKNKKLIQEKQQIILNLNNESNSDHF